MWVLARPLIESWMIDNLGPQARAREAIINMSDTLERLPHILDGIEKGAQMMSKGHIKLHSDTIRAISDKNHKLQPLLLLCLFVLFLLLITIVIKVF